MPPRLPRSVAHELVRVVGPRGLGGFAPVRRLLSRLLINQYGYATTLRPRALSLMADYTSWHSLTDRTYSGRHLPPADPAAVAALPPEPDVVSLFRRERMTAATDTSVMFMFFAQWFTDSFLRTSRSDPARNESNHEIDLCQIYGMDQARTTMLRAGHGGRLESQTIGDEEYPAFYFEPRDPGGELVVKPRFADLHDQVFIKDVILRSAPEAQKDAFFAVGLEHGNSTIGNTAMNIVFLREHNRLAGVLAAEHPAWDDDRVFETTRNVMIVLLLKLVVEEYIAHIGPFDFPIEAVPMLADDERWNRPNWCAIEFNLLYRWHSLVPDTIGTGPGALSSTAFRNNNPLVLERGVDALMSTCSQEPAGRIGLGNTPAFLVDSPAPDWPSVEQVTVGLMRKARLRSFNDYREAFGLSRLTSYDQLTSDPALRARLAELYGDVENLEWYVGIFAEEYPDYLMMGELITRMVANDAFTQALTNPLLARNVFCEDTFTATGLRTITQTRTLQQIVARSSKAPSAVRVSFSYTAG